MIPMHPLFLWMQPYPDLVMVKQITHYARGLGFAAIPFIGDYPLGDPDKALKAFASQVDGCLLEDYRVAGGWIDKNGKMVLLTVQALTPAAHALWLLTSHQSVPRAPSLAALCCPASLIEDIREYIYDGLGCVSYAAENAEWQRLEPCLAAVLDAFQVAAIDPLEPSAQAVQEVLH